MSRGSLYPLRILTKALVLATLLVVFSLSNIGGLVHTNSHAPPFLFAEAVSLRLVTTEYPPSKGSDPVQRAVVDSKEQHCLLLQLAADTPEVTVRFSYASNLSAAAVHLPVVVTMHQPSAPYSGQILLHDKTHVMQHRVFQAHELMFDHNSEAARAGKRKKTDVTMRVRRTYEDGVPAADDDMNPRVKPMHGAYGLCFGLDHPKEHYSSGVPTERVTIEIREVLYGHDRVARRPGGPPASPSRLQRNSRQNASPSATGRYTRKGGRNKREQAQATLTGNLEDDATIIYENTVRKLYHAEDEMDVSTLLAEDVVSSQQLKAQLELVDFAHRRLERIQDMTKWQREREWDMRKTTESTFTRVWVATVVLMLGISLSLYVTFSYTKRIIVKRKII